MIRNLLKYTIGLPILIIITIGTCIMNFVMIGIELIGLILIKFLLGGDYYYMGGTYSFNGIIDLWKPIK